MITSPDYAGLIRDALEDHECYTGTCSHCNAVGALDALLAENARLVGELEAVRADRKDLADRRGEFVMRMVTVETECDSLRIQMAALEKDAARYRWLRDASRYPTIRTITGAPIDSGKGLDAAIDAALTRGTEQK